MSKQNPFESVPALLVFFTAWESMMIKVAPDHFFLPFAVVDHGKHPLYS
ncbi:MAG: hypothetical protein WBA93_13650 [Microcoleaceae cyanobacterium]